jgi:hypothetical protein
MLLDRYEDTSPSMMESATVNTLNSTLRKTGPKSRCPQKLCSWNFLLTIKADFARAVTQLEGRGTEERTPTRMAHFLPGNFYLENHDVS